MTVRFEGTREDIVRYFLYLNDRIAINRFFVIASYFVIALVGFIAFSKLLSLFQFFHPAGLVSLLVDLGVIYGLFNFRKLNAHLAMKAGAGKTLTGHMEYSVTPEGMVALSRYSRSLLFWNGIESIVETRDLFAFHYSAAQAFFIPKRAFASAAQGAEFLRLIEQYRQQATGEPIPQTTKGAWWTQGEAVVEEPLSNRRGGS